MTRGKLDEELARMSQLVDGLSPGALLLCNESFASTNEQEGSEIARQVVTALIDSGVTVYYVTHLYELADSLHRRRGDTALYLRAQRLPDRTRTFRMVPGAPQPTSHGEDSYRRILGDQPEAVEAEAGIGSPG
jgi:DNA mismatch repair ATPase MutS